MAQVYIEGLGDVKLEGNTPNAAEKEAIINALKKSKIETRVNEIMKR